MEQVVKNRYRQGFTLLELMVVIAVLAIITTVAVPSFNTFIAKYTVDSIQQGVLSAHTLARSEAIKSGQRASVCGVSDTSSTTCITSDWSAAWMAFTETNGSVQPLRYWAGKSGISITASGTSVFTPDGALVSGSNRITISQPATGQARCIDVLLVGHFAVDDEGASGCP